MSREGLTPPYDVILREIFVEHITSGNDVLYAYILSIMQPIHRLD